ncbi:MAG: hypothetical protein AB7U23_13175 [Dehalococcoidia bacterium]
MGYQLKQIDTGLVGVRQQAALVATFADSGVAVAFDAAFPPGTILHDVRTEVLEAFNAGSTNVLIAGHASNDDAYQDAGDITEATPALYTDNVSANLGVRLSAATTAQVLYTGSGTAPTTGKSVTYFDFTIMPSP